MARAAGKKRGGFQKYLTLMSLSLSGASIYLLIYIKYVFYDLQLEAMGINNQQAGMLVSVFSIILLFTYIPGGFIVDRYSVKKCLFYSLLSTTAVIFIHAFTLSYGVALILWGLMAFTTIFVFWQALLKAIRLIGDEENQGRMYGLYYAGNGIFGAIGNALALWASNLSDTPKENYVNAVIVMGVMTLVASILVMVFVHDEEDEGASPEDRFKMKDVKGLLKKPVLWLISITIFCGYTLYSSSSFFTPYLTNVVGISPNESGIFSIVRTYVFLLLAPLGGLLVDKVFKSTTKWMMVGFAILMVIYLGVMSIPSGTSQFAVSLYTLLPGAFAMMLYGVLFSVMEEAKIPIQFTATAVGIASIIGYTPDIFMHSMYGYWLDKYANSGYNYIFVYVVICCIVGFIAAFTIRTLGKKGKIENKAAVS